MTFPDQIRAARHRLQLSQAELAVALAVDKQSVSNWECGRTTPWPREQVRVLGLLLDLQHQEATPRERVCDRI